MKKIDAMVIYDRTATIRDRSRFFVSWLDGIVSATIGTLFMVYPGSGVMVLTLVLSFYFIAGGSAQR